MNPRKLNQRVEILTLKNLGNNYSWEKASIIWAEVTALDKINIFSKVGIGAKSFKFVIRKRDLTLHNAFKWRDNHCFITDIKDMGRLYLEVTAAMIEPRACTVTRSEIVKNSLNRPVESSPVTITFPGCLVEKYLGHKQQIPQVINEIAYVLVTPKSINLEIGDLIEIKEDVFNIKVAHVLDEYKNEYEIFLKKDG